MAKQKKPVYRVQMTEGKRNIIHQLLEEYDISETIEDIYGFETSEGFISDVTDKILPQIEDWQNRPLDEVYPILYIDAIHYSVCDNGMIRKLAAYVILGINTEGKKEVLTISVGENESSKYWLSILNELKNRGVRDILVICADGLTGIKEAIAADEKTDLAALDRVTEKMGAEISEFHETLERQL